MHFFLGVKCWILWRLIGLHFHTRSTYLLRRITFTFSLVVAWILACLYFFIDILVALLFNLARLLRFLRWSFVPCFLLLFVGLHFSWAEQILFIHIWSVDSSFWLLVKLFLGNHSIWSLNQLCFIISITFGWLLSLVFVFKRRFLLQ